ncbi:peptidoglycan DD-metalloendopeptidase family protein, partial [Micromonospora sp. MW-13]|uniref:peptidoglycan DD-metalloendopeptidase family protein n=2 Tax=unclassified Micromonospora TaxID=2617518 RepID=UPI001A9D1CA2
IPTVDDGRLPASAGQSEVSSLRRITQTLVAAMVTCLAIALSAVPAHAAAQVRVHVPSGLPLNIRNAPALSGAVIGSVPNGSVVTITCHVRGDAVQGFAGVTNIWNRLSSGGWLTDGFLETGSNGPVVPLCGSSSAQFKLPFPAGRAYTITQAAGSSFSHNDAYNRHAIDFGMPVGVPILASAAGTIRFEGWATGGGIMALVDHGNNRCSQYAHLSATIINTGDRVAQGQRIGTSGATGNVTGPHLHWNIVNCDSHTSREIPNSVEVGTNYVVGRAPVSQNG